MIENPLPTERREQLRESQRHTDLETIVAVVMPAYKVTKNILKVIEQIGPEVAQIIVVDDACPEHSGALVEQECPDPRVKVIFNERNQGVGGAVIAGYREAIARGAQVVVKLDSDGQMDPKFIPKLIRPIIQGKGDYTKGNRFFWLESLHSMPPVRIFGNAVLSFMTKLSTGYWNIFDPTNGYTAIHAGVLSELPLVKISRRYFFETDMLFRLNTIRAVVVDVPMQAFYGDETSNLNIGKVIPEFMFNHLVNLVKRIFYSYFLRNFSVFSIQLVLGSILTAAGTTFGAIEWYRFASKNIPATSGIVMIAALPIIVGVELLLSFLNWDAQNIPTDPLQYRL
jgi:dolichol-phosphate mannosyltransferase